MLRGLGLGKHKRLDTPLNTILLVGPRAFREYPVVRCGLVSTLCASSLSTVKEYRVRYGSSCDIHQSLECAMSL
jgi:hypothetical protein